MLFVIINLVVEGQRKGGLATVTANALTISANMNYTDRSSTISTAANGYNIATERAGGHFDFGFFSQKKGNKIII